jgi:hypothetical protein
MSRAFVREGGGAPQVFTSRESAEAAAKLAATMDGGGYTYEVRARSRGGFMVARLNKDGVFESWIEDSPGGPGNREKAEQVPAIGDDPLARAAPPGLKAR